MAGGAFSVRPAGADILSGMCRNFNSSLFTVRYRKSAVSNVGCQRPHPAGAQAPPDCAQLPGKALIEYGFMPQPRHPSWRAECLCLDDLIQPQLNVTSRLCVCQQKFLAVARLQIAGPQDFDMHERLFIMPGDTHALAVQYRDLEVIVIGAGDRLVITHLG